MDGRRHACLDSEKTKQNHLDIKENRAVGAARTMATPVVGDPLLYLK